MAKKVVTAGIVVLLAWMATDFGVHSVVLKKSYAATRQLWRPHMLPHVMYLAKLCVALVLAHLYSLLVKDKSMKTAVEFGLWYGVAVGVTVGYGSYAVMPIPASMAFLWFISTAIDGVIAGLIIGAIVRETPEQAAAAEPEPEQEPAAEPQPEPESSQEEEASGEDAGEEDASQDEGGEDS